MSIQHSFDLEDILNEENDEVSPNFYPDFDLESLLLEEDDPGYLAHDQRTDGGIQISEDISSILEKFSKSVIDSQEGDEVNDEAKKEIDLLIASDDSDEADGDALSSFRRFKNDELKSLGGGFRQVISALDVKSSDSGSSTSEAANAVYAGNVRCTELDVITSQLKRNATYKAHGPGVATSLSVHDRFIAVGTARGLVLLFDQNQEIRQVVGALLTSPTARCFDSVTAVDINSAGTLLLCGYETGEVALWDLTRGAILKRLTDLHSDAITRLRFIPGVGELAINQSDLTGSDQLIAVSADRTGVCFRFRLTKTVLFNTYNVEQDCLLNGSAGQVLDISPLKPCTVSAIVPPREAQAQTARSLGVGSLTSSSLLSARAINQLSNIGLTISGADDSPNSSRGPTSTHVQIASNWALLAISTTNRTYVLQVSPVVKISYKWSAPVVSSEDPVSSLLTEENADGSEQPSSARMKPKIISCLDWTWSRRRYEVLQTEPDCLPSSRQRSATADSVDSQPRQRAPSDARPAAETERVVKFLDSSFEENGSYFPLLARSWGGTVQVLAVVQFTAPATPTPVQPASSSPFKYLRVSPEKRPESAVAKDPVQQLIFDVVASRSFPVENFLTMRWLNEKTIVATTAVDIRFLNQNLEPVETIALNSPLAAFHQSMLLSTSPLIDYGSSKCPPNCVTVHASRFFVMTPEALFSFQMQSWTEKVDALVQRNEWLEGLSIALQYGVAQEGVQMERALPKKIAKTYRLALDNYLRRYLDLAIYQSFSMRKVSPTTAPRAAHSLSQDHFQLVVAVCVEYCVVAKRVNLLFTDVFSVFASVGQEALFLDALEPQILSRTLSTLPDTILEAMLEHTERSGNFVSFERCLTYLNFDNYSNDEPVIQAIQTMLLERNLITGYLYLKAIGLREFESAFRGACLAVHTTTNEEERARMTYKVLLFLQYCSESRAFPHGDNEIISSSQVLNLATLLMGKTLEDGIVDKLFETFEPQKHALCREKLESAVKDIKSLDFPYLSVLCKSDVAATVYCASLLIKCLARSSNALDSMATQLLCALHSFVSALPPSEDTPVTPSDDDSKLKRSSSVAAPDLTTTPTALVFQYCLDEIVDNSQSLSHELIQDFIYHCELSLVHISRLELERKVGHMVSLQSVYADLQQFLQELLMAHGLWVALLSMHNRRQFMHTPMMLETSLRSYLMHLSKMSKSQRAKNSAHSRARSNSGAVPLADASILFSYIDLTFEAQQADGITHEETSVLKQSLCKYLIDLHTLDAERTKGIVSKYLLESCADVLQNTESQPGVQFEILHFMVKTVQSGDAKAIASHFTTDNIAVYVKLLVTFRAKDAYSFLSGCTHYSLEECLALCRPVRDAYDATALLMERAGDVPGALQLLFASLATAIVSTKEAVEALLNEESVTSSRRKLGITQSDTLKKLDCYKELQRVSTAIANLCSRNSDKTNSALWFQAFDRFLAERQASRRAGAGVSDTLVALLGLILRDFMSRMQTCVPPQEIIRRVTSAPQSSTTGQASGQATKVPTHSGNHFAEYREVMLSMIEGQAGERNEGQLMREMIAADLQTLGAAKYQVLRTGRRIKDSDIRSEWPRLLSEQEAERQRRSAELLNEAEIQIGTNNISISNAIHIRKIKDSFGRMKQRESINTYSGTESMVSRMPLDTKPQNMVQNVEGWPFPLTRNPGSLPSEPTFRASYESDIELF